MNGRGGKSYCVAMKKTRILFVCHGNICRSPTAEFVMKDLVKKAGLETRFEIESAAVSSEELGNPVYPPARRTLEKHGISCGGKFARLLTHADYDNFDVIAVMDFSNLSNARRICGGDAQNKIKLLLEFAGRPNCEVDDPWYSGGFEAAYADILSGCKGLLESFSAQD